MKRTLLRQLSGELDRLSREIMGDGSHTSVGVGDGRESSSADQVVLARRLDYLRKVLAELPQVDGELHADRAGFGSEVEVEDLSSGARLSYVLLSGESIDPEAGEVSISSPVGHALLGARAGEEIEVTTPGGRRRLRVVTVSTLMDLVDGGGRADSGSVEPVYGATSSP